MDVSLNHGDDLPKELLSKTNWNDFKELIVGTLISNFFITYKPRGASPQGQFYLI